MRTFLVLCKKRKFFTEAPPSPLVLLYCTFLIENHAVLFEGGNLRKKLSLHANISCVMQETKIFHQGPPPQLEDLRKKFSFDANISCVMQETKIFHRGPPLTISVTILYFKYRKSGGSNRRWKIYGRNSLLMRTFLVFCKERKYFT